MLKNLLLSAAIATGICSALAAPLSNTATTAISRDPLLPFAHTYLGQRALTQNTHATTPRRAAAVNPDACLPVSDDFGYLNAPDGSTWYYICNYEKEIVEHEFYQEEILTAYHFTVYNDKMEVIGTIDDTIELGPNETRIAKVQLGPDVTQRFFNSDDNYELMIMVVANTSFYVNNYYTRVYSLGVKDAVAEMPGYYVSALNAGTTGADEDFYITFTSEDDTETPEINGIANMADYVFTLYSKAGAADGPHMVKEFRIPMLLMAGDNALPVLAKENDGKAYFVVNYYEKCYYEDPYDYENENITPDNYLVLDFYEIDGSISGPVTTKVAIPEPSETAPFIFPYIGGFRYDDDITFGQYTSDGRPAYIISYANYESSSDSYIYDYTVVNQDGKQLLILGEQVISGVFMSPVAGASQQIMFVVNDGVEYSCNFINVITGALELNIPFVNGNLTVTADFDRTAYGDSWAYVTNCATADVDADGNALHNLVWFDKYGNKLFVDAVNIDPDVALAQCYIEGTALSPGTFDSDEAREYMFLVKRYTDNGSQTEEQLVITKVDGTEVLHLGADDGLGIIRQVAPLDLGTDQAKLCVVYDQSYKYTPLFFDLPFDASGVEDAVIDGSDIQFDGNTLVAPGHTITVYNLAGTAVATAACTFDTAALPAGVYIARAAGNAIKIVIK